MLLIRNLEQICVASNSIGGSDESVAFVRWEWGVSHAEGPALFAFHRYQFSSPWLVVDQNSLHILEAIISVFR